MDFACKNTRSSSYQVGYSGTLALFHGQGFTQCIRWREPLRTLDRRPTDTIRPRVVSCPPSVPSPPLSLTVHYGHTVNRNPLQRSSTVVDRVTEDRSLRRCVHIFKHNDEAIHQHPPPHSRPRAASRPRCLFLRRLRRAHNRGSDAHDDRAR